MSIIGSSLLNTPVIFEETLTVIWKNAKPTEIIGDDHIDIWRVTIPSYLVHVPELYKILADEELIKSASFLKESDSIRYIIGRSMLRILLARYLDMDPQEINFSPGLNKKPMLNTPGKSILDFNIGHSGDFILIAVARTPVGIDIERIDNFPEINETMQLIFEKDEIAFTQEQASPIRTFYKLWTRKEALLKATSRGIINQMKDIPSLDGRHLIAYDLLKTSCAWKVTTFNANKNYTASIAYTGKNVQLQFKEYNFSK